jgi:hypothetical protein
MTMLPTSPSREKEAHLLDRCLEFATRPGDDPAQNAVEAHVFMTASFVIDSNYPKESERLLQAAERYFGMFPDEKTQDVVQTCLDQGWVFGLPRLRDFLEKRLDGVMP